MRAGRWTSVALFVLMGVSVLGFLAGTRSEDYAHPSPLQVDRHGEDPAKAPQARSYADLRAGTTSDGALVARACTDCHEDRLQAARRGTRTEHPIEVGVPVDADLARLTAAGGRLEADEADAGSQGRVACQTCHRPHNATQDSRLIVTTDEGALCLSCHADHGPNRSRHPVNVALVGATRAAIEALGGPPTDRLSCLSCHDPHESTAGTLLRTDGSGASACQACHRAEQSQLQGGGHGRQSCVDCHGMHRASATTGRGPKAGDPGDQACVDCHAGRSGAKAQVELARGHRLWVALPEAAGQEGVLGCRTCHEAHSGNDRLLVEGDVKQTCLACHEAQATVVGTDHDAAVVAVGGQDQTCLSCHPAHGAAPAASTAGVNPVNARCLACHATAGAGTAVASWDHPKGLLLTAAGLPFRYSGEVPYFGPDGRSTTERETGEIACLTCHDPHRWKHGADQHPGAADGTEQDSFLRDANQVVAFCAVCHGTDGLPRFRFFHGDQFRGRVEE